MCCNQFTGLLYSILRTDIVQADVRSHATWLAQRPDSFETSAVTALLGALRAEKTQAAPGFRLHIAHVSSAQVLPLLAAAKAEGALLSQGGMVLQGGMISSQAGSQGCWVRCGLRRTRPLQALGCTSRTLCGPKCCIVGSSHDTSLRH